MRGPNYGHKKRPKESRTIPVHGNRVLGNGEDAGVLFKCWYCGFINRVGRDALGGSHSRSGLKHEVAILPSVVTEGDFVRLRGIGSQHVGMELDSFGNPKTIHRPYKAVSGLGCPLCGSKNWKGEY